MMRFGLRSSGRAVALGACLGLFFTGQGPANAGDAKAGRAKAESVCGVCHGVDGLAKIPEAPNLAGQIETYLIEQITAFKSGERKNEMMSLVVQDLTDTDIENLAAYYSGIQISVKTPAE